MTSGGAPRSASKGSPCAVCGATRGCSRKGDGFILCRNKQGDVPGFVYLGPSKGDAAWGQYRRADDPELNRNKAGGRGTNGRGSTFGGRARGRPDAPASDDAGQKNGHASTSAGTNGRAGSADWAAKAAELAARMTPESRERLAEALGIPSWAWPEGLMIGLGEDEGPLGKEHGRLFWSFPEKDGAGNVVGVRRRYGDGYKALMHGCHPGLIVPAGWDAEGVNVLYAPEGASDVMALAAVGLAAVGRPNDTGGVDHLAGLLSRLPAGRRPAVVVLGEFDPKPDGRWPGRDGAVKVAAELAARFGEGWDVRWALPPKGCKDAREWVRGLNLDPASADDWSAAGGGFHGALKTQKAAAAAAPEDRSYRFEALDSATFFAADYKLTWLVKRLLVRGQPGVIGGPKKALKTTAAEDLVISIASGTPFLGHFAVYRPCRVVMISGESGEAVLQETGRRICTARGVDPATLDVRWSFGMPQLANVLDRDRLAAGLKDAGAEVAVIDPLYLCALAGADAKGLDAGNLYHMGPLLLGAARACLDVGCTPIFCHHAGDQKIRTRGNEPMELGDLAFAGIAEFARQWVLMNRREPFDPETGSSRLWLSAGGSAGQSGCWGVDVEEGVLGDDMTGRTWEVVVRPQRDVLQAESEAGAAKQQAKQEARRQKTRDDGSMVLAYLDKHAPGGEGLGWSRARNGLGWDNDRMGRALQPLLDEGFLEECEVIVSNGTGKRTVKGFRRKRGDTLF